MLSEEEKTRLRPLACAWAKEQERTVLKHGVPLSEKHLRLAERAGVKDPKRVRALAVADIPIPDEEPLRSAAQKTNLLARSCRGIAIGYGVIMRGDSWADQELLAHQLVHVAQYERAGGVEPYLHRYFEERLGADGFGAGNLEQEARNVAREISGA
jgi:hypothetical protein